MNKELENLERRIRERFVKAFATYRLLEDGDHVLVGLSGGKDSLCLLEMLARRAKIDHPRFQVEALHVRMENIAYETSTEYLEHFCQELNVPLHIRTTSFSSTPTDDNSQFSAPNSQFSARPEGALSQSEATERTVNCQLKKKPACFLCSWNRRKVMFNLAQELGCNKIALGHHQDDLLTTTLMNLIYQGRFDTMPALLKMRKMPLSIIRPLCMVEESDIIRYAELRGYEKQVKRCPYEHDTNRTEMERLFREIEQKNPDARHSMWNALNRDNKLTEE
jgi:tRNA(Ile)-lysidine synthase TilS/MesJ